MIDCPVEINFGESSSTTENNSSVFFKSSLPLVSEQNTEPNTKTIDQMNLAFHLNYSACNYMYCIFL